MQVFQARKKLLPFKDFFCEVTLTQDPARISNASKKETLALINFLLFLFNRSISIPQSTYNLVCRKKKFKTLFELYSTKSLKKTLINPKELSKFTSIIAILLEVLFR